ncbi:PREDICTED: LOW QUALITY PROTEIN: RING-H2 finger protein ATL33 [Tarenaya hassleriana]|uniref:LOW QUALITY PROTEIN: RING-H2 finger protein ATL33 n=1 Tax=Tarenaya hassleriana TaxID=28532 RepID=UPI00053CA183|nr:PREDICTED: LOW QUALITY PROTEIN: RING-H2 finger protein ATL33 [Tarenaya hassleriana]
MPNNSTATTGSPSSAGTTNFPATVFPGGGGVASNSTFTLIGPPPPFPAPPRSVDLSPLKFILAVIAVIAVPALAYALFFSVPCSSGRRRRRSFSSDDLPSSPPPPPPSRRNSGGRRKFKKESHSKEIGNECPVCLSVFADGEEVRQLSTCKHAFHASCIEMWLADHSNCPICRATVNIKRQEGNGNGNVNGNRNGGGDAGNRRVPANNRVDDWHQGLPDASYLV